MNTQYSSKQAYSYFDGQLKTTSAKSSLNRLKKYTSLLLDCVADVFFLGGEIEQVNEKTSMLGLSKRVEKD